MTVASPPAATPSCRPNPHRSPPPVVLAGTFDSGMIDDDLTLAILYRLVRRLCPERPLRALVPVGYPQGISYGLPLKGLGTLAAKEPPSLPEGSSVIQVLPDPARWDDLRRNYGASADAALGWDSPGDFGPRCTALHLESEQVLSLAAAAYPLAHLQGRLRFLQTIHPDFGESGHAPPPGGMAADDTLALAALAPNAIPIPPVIAQVATALLGGGAGDAPADLALVAGLLGKPPGWDLPWEREGAMATRAAHIQRRRSQLCLAELSHASEAEITGLTEALTQARDDISSLKANLDAAQTASGAASTLIAHLPGGHDRPVTQAAR